MPLNIPGLLVPFQFLVNPRLVLPALTVGGEFRHWSDGGHQTLIKPFIRKDIRRLDFAALRQAGYRGAVFDKDNCLVSSI